MTDDGRPQRRTVVLSVTTTRQPLGGVRRLPRCHRRCRVLLTILHSGIVILSAACMPSSASPRTLPRMTDPTNPPGPSDRLRFTLANQNPSPRAGWNQDSQLDRRPEVVARVQHLRYRRDVCLLVTYRQVIDSYRRLQPELGSLPVQKDSDFGNVTFGYSRR